MEYLTVIRWFNLACALMCGWTYATSGNFIVMCIGALNLAVFWMAEKCVKLTPMPADILLDRVWSSIKKAVKK